MGNTEATGKNDNKTNESKSSKHHKKRNHSSSKNRAITTDKTRKKQEDVKLVLETTQDLERLELEMLNEVCERNNLLDKMEESFEKQKLKQLTQAERILQESKREAHSRERFFTQRQSNETAYGRTEQKQPSDGMGIGRHEEQKLLTERPSLGFKNQTKVFN